MDGARRCAEEESKVGSKFQGVVRADQKRRNADGARTHLLGPTRTLQDRCVEPRKLVLHTFKTGAGYLH